MKVVQSTFYLEDKEFYSVSVYLPKTTFLAVGNDVGYFSCGALDVSVFNLEHLVERNVICGRALGVKTIDQLLNAPLKEITVGAKKLGVVEGMITKDALLVIS